MISGKTLDSLEFPKLLGIISSFCHSEASAASVLNLRPLYDGQEIKQRFGLILEIRRLSHDGTPLRISEFTDLSPRLRKVAPEGAMLDPVELAGFMPVLRMAAEISAQIQERQDLRLLRELTGTLTGHPDILALLERSFDQEGNILDEASFKLFEIREDIRRKESRIRKKMDDIVQDEKISVFLQDDFITKRSERWVIPVRMDSKGQIPGVVHDVSKSGETAFIEPLSIIPLSNELENLLAEQKAEEMRILRHICSRIRTIVPEIETEFKVLVYLDVLNSIVELSGKLHLEVPEINSGHVISLCRARHPLLMLSLQKAEGVRDVVPLDVTLGKDHTVMIITGSNAGGKTVTIKTIGLLMLMAQTGMPIPADGSSSVPLVNNLLIDIGDEQSIEENLSTFSAHVSHIAEIVEQAGPDTLVLIDELGTGTDPDEGSALACAVLQEVQTSGALVFATTHLIGIKSFVYRREGMINASMEFDYKTQMPLYRLRVGEPGQSNALEIAGKFGLPQRVIDTAKGMLGSEKVELDFMISDLAEKRLRYEHDIEELGRRRRETEEKSRMLEEKLASSEVRMKEVLAGAYREAAEIVRMIKRQMYALLEDAKKKEREALREDIKEAELKQAEIGERLRAFEPIEDHTPSPEAMKAGDAVFVKSLGIDAFITGLNLKQGRVKVRAGSVEVEVPVSDISFGKGKPRPERETNVWYGTVAESASSRINLVGLRVDEALSRLEPFLNHAALAGLREVVIIHGIGKGILARAIRDHVTGHPLVEQFRSGEVTEGGAGVTIVTLA